MHQNCIGQGGWRRDAAKIVEELFAVTPAEEWDRLLDLRGLLLSGQDWDAAIQLFLECRDRLEMDHYLPFYRLRRLMAASLRLDGESPQALRRLLAQPLGRLRLHVRGDPAASRVVEIVAP